MRISAPNYTQISNDLLDNHLPNLGEAELKVLLVIMRKTIGWHKIRDKISISQLSSITGLLRETVIKAAKSLVEKHIITKEVVGPLGKQVTYYELVIHDDSNNSYQSVEPTTQGRGGVGLNLLGSTDSQKKDLAKEKRLIDDAGAREKIKESKMIKGSEIPIDDSEIYRHMLQYPEIPTEIVSEAIKRARQQKSPMRNINRYIEAVCKNLMDSTKRQVFAEKTHKENKKPKQDSAPPKYEGPTENLLEAIERKKNERKI
jgi:phage replication O-like protein O